MTLRRTFTCGAVLTATLVGQALAAAPSADALLAELAHDGARTVLARLDADPARKEAVLDRIESGEPAWLAVARRVRTVADAGDAEALDIAVARALPRAPGRVLALIDHGFTIAAVCTSPFIEPGPGVAAAYRAQALTALTALEAVRTPASAACARHVKASGG